MSVAGALTSAAALSAASATGLACGRVWLDRLPSLTTWSSTLRGSIRQTTATTATSVSPSAASTQSGATNIIKLPLAFVRSGWVNVSTSYTGGVLNAGGTGYGWSRTAGSTTDAYTLAMGPTGVNPSSNHYRWLGYPLRCLT